MPKPASTRAKPAKPVKPSGVGSTFVGILIGLVLGLFIALGVAWYINKLPNPFREKPQGPKLETPVASDAKSAPPDPGKITTTDAAAPKVTESATDKPKLSAQEMLTKGEGTAATPEKAADTKSTPEAKDAFFLQAGSFQNAPDADNLKARLALLGIEAAIQTRTLADKGVWHRVRIGPYSDIEELNRMRGVLTQNNIETALVKVREADK